MGANNQSQVDRMEAKINITENKLETRVSNRAPVGGYHEVPEKSVRPDVLEQFKMNLGQLEELHGRLKFLLSEIRTAIKKS